MQVCSVNSCGIYWCVYCKNLWFLCMFLTFLKLILKGKEPVSQMWVIASTQSARDNWLINKVIVLYLPVTFP